MITTVVSPGAIPDFVHPPVPGESHDFYGDTHLDSIKLPASATAEGANNSAQAQLAQYADRHRPHDNNSQPDATWTHEAGTAASPSIDSAHNPVIGTTTATDADQIEGSSDDVAWARLVEACIHGEAEKVQEILLESPQLKESIDNISSATGMNPLHFAASRGQEDVVRILVDAAGAGVDVPDREGERGANVHQRDKDGWTALHNASSKGYIAIAQVLLEKGEADINARSKMGHTPLINAASKGDISMVLYFLNHAKADPLLKNKFSEMAYDVAAANSEAYLCDILQTSEKQWWKGNHTADQVYDPLVIHTTVLTTIHESQRAAGSFPLSLMAPKFSASALTQQDVCGPWSLPNGRPFTKDDVHLPLIPATGSSSSRNNMQRGWFWLTEWVVDKTDPNVDNEGWQYAKSLTEANQQWSAIAPTSGSNWVRRRKWIRVMKKRMDLVTPSTDFLEESEETMVQELAGNYMRRASLALRLDDGFSDSAQELARYRQAIQILLKGIKLDKDPASKLKGAGLVQEYLHHAEDLTTRIQEREEAANGIISQLDTPRIALRAADGSPGSSNELRSLTLQKSRPSDMETMEALPIHMGHAEDDGTTEESSEDSLDSTSNSVESQDEGPDQIDETASEGQELEQQPSSAAEQLLSTSAFAALEAISHDAPTSDAALGALDGTVDSEATFLSSEVRADEAPVEAEGSLSGSDSHTRQSSASIPITTSHHEPPEVAVISPSPAAAQSDPFPMARLTRSPRSGTPTSFSSRSNAPPSDPVPSSPSAMGFQSETRPTSSHNHSGSGSGQGSATASSGPSRIHDTPPSTRGGISESRQSSSSAAGTNHHSNPDRRASSMQTPHHRQPQAQQHFHSPPPVFEAKWELDSKAIECRECHRKFSLFLRRHHCRRCGHVVCDKCSSHRATLHPSMVVYDPSSNEAFINHQALSRRNTYQSYRVCDSCHESLGPARSLSLGSASGSASGSGSGAGSQLQYHRSYHGQPSSHNAGGGRHYPSSTAGGSAPADGSVGVYLPSSGYGQNLRSHSSSRSSSSSNLHPTPMVRNASSSSLMSECPVCGAVLAGLEGGKAAQEAHVQDCLEGKPGQGSGPINNVRYIVYKLPADSPLIDQECAICFEEFVAGENSSIAEAFG
ncbi:hypothetical protein BGZ72_003635 [Mortierella alpina]|nr:hypothetical protein BGZ72_003635 [Mortierella alpina]